MTEYIVTAANARNWPIGRVVGEGEMCRADLDEAEGYWLSRLDVCARCIVSVTVEEGDET